jgi:3'-phosphoadenosine 5'-phosphosulfate sulfotransferase (PAPS reductase)/FAD synthetase
MKVLSLGAGVQSTTVLRMVIAGELERIDHAIFADTGWEPPDVYSHLEALRQESEDAGIPVHVVKRTPDGVRGDIVNPQGPDHQKWFATLPLYILGPDGARGIGRRQCTREYKVRPVERRIRELAGLRYRQRWTGPPMEHWFGISADETRRVRMSPHRWSTFYYPLV